jgi:hypothetical protein
MGQISDVGTQTELRVLRSRSSASFDGGEDLHIRVHVLRGMRDERAEGALSELQRRFGAPAHSARSRACEISGVNEARVEG